ncbi:MAG: immunoglobulin domain-containing protein [Rhodoferax sp.]|nr:immunoglobulin domain-containing protein [Rhodoferax sp.]
MHSRPAGGADKPVASTPPVNTDTAPSITTPPDNPSVVAGEQATFTVLASGNPPPTYQWKLKGADISGATSNTYTTPVTSIADDGATYSVSVSNRAGTVTSNATLTVKDKAEAPVITTQPAAQFAIPGQTATFSVKATGTSLRYQWKKGETDINGATNSSYTTPPTTPADNGTPFSVVVSNTENTVPSAAATLTVSAQAVEPSITAQPLDQSVNEGQTATFSVTATGTALNYQWKKGDSTIPGATSSTYTIAATHLADNNAVFTVVVSNSAGTRTSSHARLAVTALVAPAISTQPVSQTVRAGQTATFTVAATGTAPLIYQWRKGNATIPGATASSYETPATTSADNGAQFSVTVSNSVTSVTSDSASLTVGPGITAQPAAQTVAPDKKATFTVAATGTGTLRYQWKKAGADIDGATSSSYETPATTSADTGTLYSVVVTDSVGSVTSSDAMLTVSRYSELPNGSGGTYARTECIQDNATGLVWEGKNPNGSDSRAGDTGYTNYDSRQAVGAGIDINAITNSIGYVISVNSGSELCGFNDWRLPEKNEFEGIILDNIQHTGHFIDNSWFPNTQSNGYWTSSLYNNNLSTLWFVDFSAVNSANYSFRYNNFYVRLVRCGAVAPATCTSM